MVSTWSFAGRHHRSGTDVVGRDVVVEGGTPPAFPNAVDEDLPGVLAGHRVQGVGSRPEPRRRQPSPRRGGGWKSLRWRPSATVPRAGEFRRQRGFCPSPRERRSTPSPYRHPCRRRRSPGGWGDPPCLREQSSSVLPKPAGSLQTPRRAPTIPSADLFMSPPWTTRPGRKTPDSCESRSRNLQQEGRSVQHTEGIRPAPKMLLRVHPVRMRGDLLGTTGGKMASWTRFAYSSPLLSIIP